MAVRKPANNVYFRVHSDPAMALDASVLIGDGGSDDFYFVAPSMLNHHVVLPRLRKVTIATVYTWPGGAISLWPVPMAEETRIACWKSARAAYELAKQQLGATVLEQRHCATTTWQWQKGSMPSPSGRRQDSSAICCGSASPTRSSPRQSIPMSSNCAGLPTSLDRFREIWDHDFEFRQDENGRPVPIALFAKEHRTGREISMRREQLLACAKAPFDVGPDTLITSYSIVSRTFVLSGLALAVTAKPIVHLFRNRRRYQRA